MSAIFINLKVSKLFEKSKNSAYKTPSLSLNRSALPLLIATSAERVTVEFSVLMYEVAKGKSSC